jgi:hypothetical protein
MLVILFEGVANRLEREHNQRVLQAWQTAALYRVKRLPSLKKLLLDKSKKQSTPKKQQKWERQLQIAKQWHDLLKRK